MTKAKHLQNVCLVLLAFSACGTGIGNPAGSILSPPDQDISDEAPENRVNSEIKNLYDSSAGFDCGKATVSKLNAPSAEDIRDCLAARYASCESAFGYLKVELGSVFHESVMRIGGDAGDCQFNLRTASSNPDYFTGERSRLCSPQALGPLPEFECEIETEL